MIKKIPKAQPDPSQDLTLAQAAKQNMATAIPNVDDPNITEEVRAEERRARKQRGRKSTLATGEPMYAEDKTIAEGFM